MQSTRRCRKLASRARNNDTRKSDDSIIGTVDVDLPYSEEKSPEDERQSQNGKTPETNGRSREGPGVRFWLKHVSGGPLQSAEDGDTGP